jgi:ADP-ribose pyrophosphatase YjhB (NUDIX family)
MQGTWAFPGGHLEWGERLIEAVQREFREETGLLVRPVKLLHVAEVITDDAHYVILDYGVTASQFDVTVDSDASDWRWVNYREIDAMPLAAGMAQCLTQSAVRSWLGWRE